MVGDFEPRQKLSWGVKWRLRMEKKGDAIQDGMDYNISDSCRASF
jgi:hypothetical protein